MFILEEAGVKAFISYYLYELVSPMSHNIALENMFYKLCSILYMYI